jgi:hypothetical protein
VLKRIYQTLKRAIRAIGHEIAETIRFGAIPSAAAPRGRPAQTPPAAAVAGISVLGMDAEREPPDSIPDEERYPDSPEDGAP